MTERINEALGLVGKLTRAQTINCAADVFRQAVEPFGVMTYAASVLENPERSDPRANLVSDYPKEWTEIYLKKRRYLIDPVVNEALRSPGSFFWRDISDATSTSGREIFEEARQFGMLDGFVVSARSPWPAATIVSLAGKQLLWNELEQGVVSLLATTFVGRILYLRDQTIVPAVKALSPQEKRVLYLAAEGGSDKAIALSLGLHASTVRTHWERIRAKLCATDRANAVAVGLWSGQIAP